MHARNRVRTALAREAKILFDADKLDILGAIEIIRSFMIAGQYGDRSRLILHGNQRAHLFK
jgi:HD superfamily phosphodiesterase